MPDSFGSVRARPSAILPDHWLLDLPSEVTTIHIRRYVINADAALPPGDTHVDPLEIAWRRVNEQADGDACIAKTLESASAIIDSDGVTRQLWTFASDQAQLGRYVGGLQELEPTPSPIPVSQLVSCLEHGHKLSCVQRSQSGELRCHVVSNLDPDVRHIWDLFSSALVEKLAWKSGRRVSLRPPSVVNTTTYARASLYPLFAVKLLLNVQQVVPSLSRPFAHPPYSLQPINLPAVRLDAAQLTPSQEARLSSAFESALGSTWKHGRSDARTRFRIHGRPFTEWSFFWVPLVNGEPISPKSFGKLTPERWQRSQGIITVWPTHMAQEPRASEYTRPDRPRKSALAQVASSSDLMGIASNFFDFMTAYREPPVIDPNDEDIEVEVKDDEDQTMDAESVTGPGSSVPVQEASPKSDLDDLFSAHSDSPGPPELLDEDPPDIFESAEDSGNGNLDLGVERMPRSRASSHRPMEEKTETKQDDFTNQITEDDFAFFDSPNDPGEDLEEMQVDHPILAPETNDAEVEAAPALKTVNGLNTHQISPPPLDEPLPPSPPLQKALAASSEIFALTPVEVPPLACPAPPPEAPVIDIGPVVYTLHSEIIPGLFLPVNLPPSTQPIPTYSLPSPAPTPEGLRPDLIERLKPASNKEYNYASAWQMETDPSEMDDDEEDYTGPPSPESFLDTEDEMSVKPTPIPGTGQRLSTSDEEAVEFDGITCVSIEWLSLKDDLSAARNLSRPWNDGWLMSAKETIVSHQSITPSWSDSPSKLSSSLNIERFMRLLPGNRALREWTPPFSINHSSSMHTEALYGTIGDDTTLSELDPDLRIRHLSPPEIHAGYSGNIMRLSIAGLQYWSELGLQPSGGMKNVEALCICDNSETSKVHATRFLADMRVVYEDCRLGHHRSTSVPYEGVAGGIAAIGMNKLGDTIRKLDKEVKAHTIVYVLLPSTSILTQSFVEAIASINTQSNIVVQLVPPTPLGRSALSSLALEIYDRISRPLHSIHVRGEEINEDVRVTYPAFSLARTDDMKARPEFQLCWPVKSYDVLNRFRVIHIAYGYDFRLDVLVAVAMDDLGEAWEPVSWRLEKDDDVQHLVERVWEWARKTASGWAAEYKLTLCRLGFMPLEELQAWRGVIEGRTTYVTLLMVDPSISTNGRNVPRPRQIANISTAALSDPNARLVDSSLLGQSVTFPSTRIPVDLPPSVHSENQGSTTTFYPQSSFILTTDESSNTYHVLYHRARYNGATKEGVTVGGMENELIDDYHKLWAISRRRWGEDVTLPGHLQALQWGLKGLRWLAGEADKENTG